MEHKLKWEKLLSTIRLNGTSGANKDIRNAFESDYGRVIFSPATRRMHDKTQVFPLSDDDNIHTRLTHSQEVMSLGYTFGIKLVNEIFDASNNEISEKDFEFLNNENECIRCSLLRTIPVILQTVCLFHDIGNTPFGHFGEDTISNYFENLFENNDLQINDEPQKKLDFTEYDGNAQGLRVLTKLQILDNIYGLNLTSSVLSTYLKYPNKNKKKVDQTIANKKHGVFFSENEHFNKIIENCGLNMGGKIVRHPLCFLMEAADTIAYRTMDVEDGFNKNLYDTDIIIDAVLVNIPNDEIFYEELEYLKKDKSINERVKMVRLRIKLIDHLVNTAFETFKVNYISIMNGDYQKELLDDDKFNVELSLGIICKKYIYDSPEVNSMEVTGNSVIVGLLDFYINALITKTNCLEKKAYNMISKSFIYTSILENKGSERNEKSVDISKFGIEDFRQLDNYYKLRVIVDFISGMTDQYALKHYQLISGLRLK
jgi:dGTPase